MQKVSPDPKRNPIQPAVTRWLKADLHLHTAEDPYDEIGYTALELLTRAHAKGFQVLAITLHDKVFSDPQAFALAAQLGIVLIPAVERRIEGADVVLLNLSAREAAEVSSFEGLRRLRARRGDSLFVFAPHPFYRFGGSIGQRIEKYLDCFDAVELCHFHLPWFDPNARASRLANRCGKPFLATSDAHCLRFFGEHYTLLELEDRVGRPTVEEVFAAIRAKRIRSVSPSGGWPRFLALLFFIFVVHPFLVRLPGSKRNRLRENRRTWPPGIFDAEGTAPHPPTAV